jgi:uncharacterized protein YjbJ (UPF0337 family)
MVTQQQIEGNWNQIKGRVKQRWGQLTDDDLRTVEGHANELVGLIQKKTGQARDEIERVLDEWTGSDPIGRTKEATQRVAEQAGEQARHAYDQVSGKVREGYEQVSETITEGYAQAEQLVRQRPAESVAVAFGTGLIAGIVIGLVIRSR